MNRPPPYHPVVPLHMVQPGYQQYMNLGNTAVAGQTLQAPQLTATDPTIWQVQNHTSAPAFISTHFGRYEKRDMVADHKVTPILRSNVAAGVSAKATSLRQAYPELIRHIKKPTFWDDLYFLWDAADIQLEGPEFLYYVMHRLGAENEQLDREYEEAQNNEIDEYARTWVTNHRELVLNSVAGSMYGLFISDPAENDDFAQEWRSILSKALEAHRLRLLHDSSNLVNLAAPKLLQSKSMPRKTDHQTTDAFHARAVSDKGDGLDRFGKRTNRSNIPPAIGSRAIPAPTSERNNELNSLGSAQPQFTSTLHVGRNLSMPLNLTTQVQSTPANQSETMDKVSALPLPLRPQTYDNFMEIQRNITPGLAISPNIPKNYRPDNRFRDKPRPRGNSIEVPHNRRNQWTAPHGAQNKFGNQSQHNNQQNTSGSMRGSPSKASQPEPIYVRNLQNLQHLHHTSGSSGHNSGQLMGSNDSAGSRMDLPNDARNHKTFQHSTVNQSLDFSPMEGDPNFQKRDDSCLYRYETTPIPKNAHGRTLYLKGPDLRMFCTHQLKDLMSTVGNVVLMKFLLRPHNNGTVFVTFDTDVLEAAIKRFDGHQMPDGRLLTAGYPSDNHIRERSGSNSSHNSYHGENHTRFMPNSGLDGRAYARRSSISQHRPSRSQSGQSQFQYPNGNHMNSQNAGNSFPHVSDFPNINSYPAPYVPRQHLQSPRLALGAVLSEVMQHERGISHFQQQMPLTASNNPINSATTSHPRSHGGFQGASNCANTNLETDLAMTNVSGLSENRKENSPIKAKVTGDTHSTSPSKDSGRNTDIKHKKSSSRRNRSTVTSPIATLIKSISQVELNSLAVQKLINHTTEVPPLSEMETSLIPGQMFTTDTTVEPEALTLDMTKQVPMIVPAPSNSINKLLPKECLETVGLKSEPVPQGKTKNSKRNKKSKPTNKLSIEKESSVFSSTSTINSPADYQTTNPSNVDEDKLFSGDSTRKPSACSSIESNPNKSLNDGIIQSEFDENDSTKPVEGETSMKSLDNEITELISATNITSAPNPSNVPAFKSNHSRSKTGAPINGSLSKSRSISANDLKRLGQSDNSDNYDSSKAPTGSVHKVEHTTAKFQGKNSGGGSSKFSGSQEQPRVDLIKNKAGLPHTSHEKGKSSGSVISTKSVDWPALTPSKSPPSSIADGKPPQVLALPALSFRQTKTVILPALPLKPRRQS